MQITRDGSHIRTKPLSGTDGKAVRNAVAKPGYRPAFRACSSVERVGRHIREGRMRALS